MFAKRSRARVRCQSVNHALGPLEFSETCELCERLARFLTHRTARAEDPKYSSARSTEKAPRMPFLLDDDGDAFRVCVCATERRDGLGAAALDRSDVNEQHLIFRVADHASQLDPELYQLTIVELTLGASTLIVSTAGLRAWGSYTN
jgi:hypothetical protein